MFGDSCKGRHMNEFLVTFGKHIQLLRRKAGLTQEKLAEKAGLSLKRLGELERGRGNPSLLSLESLSAALDISLMELFDYTYLELPTGKVKEQIVSMMQEASDEQCLMIYQLLKSWNH